MANLRSLWLGCIALFLTVCVGLSAGCTTDAAPKKKTAADPPAKTAGDDDPLSKQARAMRANSTDDRGTGLSEKSRSVESDLGLHND
jgi:hypothetical protein